jgi:hypothetical protein
MERISLAQVDYTTSAALYVSTKVDVIAVLTIYA